MQIALHPYTFESMDVEKDERSYQSSAQIRHRQLCSLEQYLVSGVSYIFTSVDVTRCEGSTVDEQDFAS